MPSIRATDFNGPKKARSAYFIFGDEVRPKIMSEVKKEGGKEAKVDVSVIAKQIAEQWKKIGDGAKKKYVTKAEGEKKIYKAQREKWEKTDDYAKYKLAAAEGRRAKSDKDAKKEVIAAGMPKRPANARFLFAASNADEITKALATKKIEKGQYMVERQKVQQAKWDALSKAKKDQFEAKAKEGLKAYMEEMAAFKETDGYKAYKESLAKSKKRLAATTKTDDDEAPKKATSAMKSKTTSAMKTATKSSAPKSKSAAKSKDTVKAKKTTIKSKDTVKSKDTKKSKA